MSHDRQEKAHAVIKSLVRTKMPSVMHVSRDGKAHFYNDKELQEIIMEAIAYYQIRRE